jgi:hypothetical protein
MILELAAEASPVSARNLCLVASWTREIAERHVYSTLITSKPGHARLFARILENSREHRKTVVTGVRYIRRLWLQAREGDFDPGDFVLDTRLLSGLLRMLPNLESIAVMPVSPTSRRNLLYPDMDNILESLSRRYRNPVSESFITASTNVHLMARQRDLGLLPTCDATFPYNAISHLRFDGLFGYSMPADGLAELCNVAVAYGNLTHLCLGPFEPTWPQIRSLRVVRQLSAFQNLAMIVFEVGRGFPLLNSWITFIRELKEERTYDHRLFVVLCEEDKDLLDEWKREIYGGDNIWERARTFTAQLERQED